MQKLLLPTALRLDKPWDWSLHLQKVYTKFPGWDRCSYGIQMSFVLVLKVVCQSTLPCSAPSLLEALLNLAF